ncbi:hypothetical protein RHIZO_00924 [Rhizobiaceae bacterium]|nr:hypothetical protein RHIZO_00924 [Rhizobiaceae bacterium]
MSRNLIRIWIQKFEAGSFDDESIAADTIQTYEARIAALQGLVGMQALEIEGHVNRAVASDSTELAADNQPLESHCRYRLAQGFGQPSGLV